MKIFLSVGATYTDRQEEFVSAFETFLGQNGCERLTVGRGSYFSSQPINAAKELMKEVDAVVVIAFTRQIIEKALDKPDSNDQKEIVNEKYPTIWNQMEAAMAFGLDLPLLMIIESGLKQEAMLKDRLEYRALITDLNPKFFISEEFKGIFSDWKKKNEGCKKNRSIDVTSLTIGMLLKSLTPSQLWKISSSVISVLVVVGSVAYWVGKKYRGEVIVMHISGYKRHTMC